MTQAKARLQNQAASVGVVLTLLETWILRGTPRRGREAEIDTEGGMALGRKTVFIPVSGASAARERELHDRGREHDASLAELRLERVAVRPETGRDRTLRDRNAVSSGVAQNFH